MRCSSKKGETLEFKTERKAASLGVYFYRGPDQGKAQVFIDDILQETVDLYRRAPQFGFERKYDQLTNAIHTVKVRVLHEKRNDSAAYQVCVDGFAIGNIFADDMRPAVRYGAWQGYASKVAINGTFRIAWAAGASVTFTVAGNSFNWITALGPNYGQADVYVDGRLKTTVDLYAPGQKWQQLIPFTGLGHAMHTVEIVVRGQSNPLSSGTGVVFDGFVILP